MSKFIVDAIVAEAKSKELTAIANLDNYLNRSSGVAEHPDIVAECVKLVKEIAEAKEIQETCTTLFQTVEEENETTS